MKGDATPGRGMKATKWYKDDLERPAEKRKGTLIEARKAYIRHVPKAQVFIDVDRMVEQSLRAAATRAIGKR